MKNNQFPIISKNLALKKIYKNIANDSKIIDQIEKILISQRNCVFKMPPPNTPVIMLFSGGLDTVSVTNILIEKYKLIIYPLYIHRSLPHSRMAYKSVKFFDNYFQNKYPNQFRSTFKINLTIPVKELSHQLLIAENNVVTIKLNSHFKQGIPLQPAIYVQQAFHYAKYLEQKNNLQVRTIFGAWLPANSIWFAYESFQSLRSIMLQLCCMDNDFSWQFSSLPMEPEMGLFLEKENLIKIVSQYHLPLEKTWTCFSGGSTHCGCCDNCKARKEAFKKANIIDNTFYGQSVLDDIFEEIQFYYAHHKPKS